ncbi:EAL domain-containing protein [Gallaecimonas kandeliae]|uniref:EAL domain-containing protein n=1 Tax=Gallaecimonas kandeliae TaxID=3029055 RepID=UPI002648E22E|nr:EAL domain-containing protein [Gallaecimonas kandeliae]WKE65607.1 EAL domain-containing protein [Gallaecimonas kandeliae]
MTALHIRLLLLLLLSLPLRAAPLTAAPYLPPQVLDVTQGLSQNSVSAIYRDAKGFLWFATQDGLNRYDGRQLQVFHADSSDPFSLNSEHLTALGGDDKGGLWIGAADGSLQRYDGQFFQSLPQPWKEAPVTQLASLGDQIFVGTRAGLWRLSMANQQWRLMMPGAILALAAGHGELWTLDSQGGLWQLQDQTLVKKADDVRLQALALDQQGEAWLAGPGRLWQWHGGSLKPRLSWAGSARAIALVSDHKGHFYLIQSHQGLRWLDPDLGLTESLMQGPKGELIQWSLSAFADSEGQLWIGTATSGVVHLPDHNRAIRYFLDGTSQAANNIRAILGDDQGLWLGTLGEGLKRLDPQGHYHSYRQPLAALLGEDPASLFLIVSALAKDQAGNLWLGTDQGLLRLDPQGQWQRFGEAQGLPKARIWTLYAKGNELWLGTSKGLLLLKDGHFQAVEDAVPVYAIASQGETLMVGREDGLCRVRPQPKCWQRPLVAHRVRSLLADGDGWWVGTQSGLLHLDAQGRLSRWEQQPGLLDDTIYAIAPGKTGQLWLSTNRGLALFDVARQHFYSPQRDQYSLEYNGNSLWVAPGGLLYFGAVNGLTEVQPAKHAIQAEHYPLQWTSVSVDGVPTALLPGQPLVLTPPIRRLSLGFADLDLGRDVRNYQYRLDGQLQSIGQERELVFTHLPSGSHLLQLSRESSHQPPLELQIRVRQPWYWQPVHLLWESLLVLLLLWCCWYLWRRRRESRLSLRRQLVDNEQRLRLAMVASGHGVWDWDWRSHTVVRTGLEFLGYAEGDIAPTPQGLSGLVHPDDKADIVKAVRRHLRGQDAHYQCVYRLRHADGHWVWVQDRGQVVERSPDGEVVRMVGTHSDISADKARERQLQLSDLVTQSMSEGVMVTNDKLVIIGINPAAERLLARKRDALLGYRPWQFLPRAGRRARLNQIRAALLQHGNWAGELSILNHEGQLLLVEAEIHWAQDQAQGANLVVLFNDITERKSAEEELRYLANYDTLTGLPNRTLFHDRLGHAMARARRSGQLVALLFLDLDRFKHVNDSLGHQFGDKLLKEVARRLCGAVRSYDTVARLGGDEFTIILEDVKELLTATLVAEKVVQVLEPAMDLAGHRVNISPSIGIALYPQDSTDPDTLVRYADTAMYHAKSRGRGNFQYYTNAMNAAAQRRLALEHGLRQALQEEGLSLAYQPRVDLASNQVVGVEALARWQHPQLGNIPPCDFIPLAEETGLISTLGAWVLREALSQQQAWQAKGIDLQMAVNLSVRQFQSQDLPGQVAALLAELGLDSNRLELELTESTLLSGKEGAARQVARLQKSGIRLALDDFGTGYSALSYLTELHFDILKLDRSFVAKLPGDGDSVAVIRAVLELAQGLGMRVVAEGIETQEQLQCLVALGCDEGQGYHFARPLPAPELEAWLAGR